LEEVDKDGKSTLSEVRIITINITNKNIITLSPNPTKNIINIAGRNLQLVQVYDAAGKLLITQKVNNENLVALHVSHLSKGIYMVIVKDAKGKNKLKKMVIE